MKPSRRDVLAAGAAATLGLPRLAAAEDKAPAAMPLRPLGRTGEKVSLFGLGCFPLGSLRRDAEAVRVALRAIDAGCNYLDTAPSYSRGVSERRVGLALKERERAKLFLATKTHTRTADAAARDLEGSLKRLGVDQIDMVQIHAVRDRADLDKALDEKRGPLKTLLEARKNKVIRFIGVTGHHDPFVMRQTFERWDFDAILFPLNCVDPHYEVQRRGGRPQRLSFLDQTLPSAVKKGLGRVAMKVFASGRLAQRGVDPAQCLRFTYGLDISTAIVGCRSTEEVDLAVREARAQRALGPEERRRLLARTRPLRGKETEWYKRT